MLASARRSASPRLVAGAAALALLVTTGMAAADAHGEAHDPDNVTAISVSMETVATALKKLEAKEYTATIDTLRQAVRLAPRHPLAHCLLAEVYLLRNNVGEAEAELGQIRESDAVKDPGLHARALYLAADVAERQKKWEPARAGWQTYLEFVGGHAGTGAIEPARARLAAVEKRIAMEAAYAGVRARIAADKDAAKR